MDHTTYTLVSSAAKMATVSAAIAMISTAGADMSRSSTSAEKLHLESTRDTAPVLLSTVSAPKPSRAKLVEELRAIRQRAIGKGMQLKTMDEIRAEIEAARELGA